MGGGLERAVAYGDYVVVEAAARESGLHPNSIKRLLRQGRLAGYKARLRGKHRWLVSRASLRAYVEHVQTFASDRPGPRVFLRKRGKEGDG
jgi:hypothetical protein